MVDKVWMHANVRKRHSRWREEQEQSSGNDSVKVALSGLAGVHGVERLNRKLGTRRLSILG